MTRRRCPAGSMQIFRKSDPDSNHGGVRIFLISIGVHLYLVRKIEWLDDCE